MPDSTEQPITFASINERNCTQIEKKALSLILKFHIYLYGRDLTMITDQKPLTPILGPKEVIPPMAAARFSAMDNAIIDPPVSN